MLLSFKIIIDFLKLNAVEISIIASLFTAATFFFGIIELNKVKKQNSIYNIIELEKELLISFRLIQKLEYKISIHKDENGNFKIGYEFDALIQSIKNEWKIYYQIIDRICFCFLHKFIPSKKIRIEYEELLIKLYDNSIENSQYINSNFRKYYENYLRKKNEKNK